MIHQCLQTALAVFEDCEDADSDLFITSYDVRKAFDSVQAYSIRAACERLNMPEPFIRYVLMTLVGARSAVYTRDGITGSFDLMSGVRQGDPLSALIFIITIDPLHAGLMDNPLFPDDEAGYEFAARWQTIGKGQTSPSKRRSRQHKLTKAQCRELHWNTRSKTRVVSTGYSDDTMIFASSWEGMCRQHAWVVDFFVAHHWQLNGDKSVLVSAKAPGDGIVEGRTLPDIDWSLVEESGSITTRGGEAPPCKPERKDIKMHGRDKEFRYLGLYIGISMKWTKATNILNLAVVSMTRRMRAHKLDLTQMVTTIREYVLPTLELGLTYVRLRKEKIDKWDIALRHAMRWEWRNYHVTRLNNDCLYLCNDLMTIFETRQVLRATQVVNTLRSVDSPAREVCETRWRHKFKYRKNMFARADLGLGTGQDAKFIAQGFKPRNNWTVESLGMLNALEHHIGRRPSSTPGVRARIPHSPRYLTSPITSVCQGKRGGTEPVGHTVKRLRPTPHIIRAQIAGARSTACTGESLTRPPIVITHRRKRTASDPPLYVKRRRGLDVSHGLGANLGVTLRGLSAGQHMHLTEMALFDDCDTEVTHLVAFVDGSTNQLAQQNTGWAAVFTLPDTGDGQDPLEKYAVFSGIFRPSYDNYAAELMGILAALYACPQHIHLTIVTDSLAACWAISDTVVAEQHRFRKGARPVVTTIRKVMIARAGSVNLIHQRSHTGMSTFLARGNARADIHAGSARMVGHGQKVPPFLFGEEDWVVWRTDDRPEWGDDDDEPSPPIHVMGSLRASLCRNVKSRRRKAWCKHETQGAMIRKQRQQLIDQMHFVRKMENSRTMWVFMLTSCGVLPSATVRESMGDETSTTLCGRCRLRAVETSEHILSCASNRKILHDLSGCISRSLHARAVTQPIGIATTLTERILEALWDENDAAWREQAGDAAGVVLTLAKMEAARNDAHDMDWLVKAARDILGAGDGKMSDFGIEIARIRELIQPTMFFCPALPLKHHHGLFSNVWYSDREHEIHVGARHPRAITSGECVGY